MDLAHARFQSFEANLCNTIFGDLPIFIILNKADTGARPLFLLLLHLFLQLTLRPHSSAASPEQARIVKNQILSLNLSNCKAVFEVGTEQPCVSVVCVSCWHALLTALSSVRCRRQQFQTGRTIL